VRVEQKQTFKNHLTASLYLNFQSPGCIKSLYQGSPTFWKLRATSWYKFMRRAITVMQTLLK